MWSSVCKTVRVQLKMSLTIAYGWDALSQTPQCPGPVRLGGDYNLQILVSSSYPFLDPSHKSVCYYYYNELQLNSAGKKII